MAKAKEEKFDELHNLVTEEFLKRVRSGEATTQDLSLALLCALLYSLEWAYLQPGLLSFTCLALEALFLR